MVKTMLLVASAFTLLAAAPSKYGSLSAPLYEGATVAPQSGTTPERMAGSSFTPAPLPDFDASAPALPASGPAQAKVTPSLFHTKKLVRGDGYMPGSTVEGNEQRNFNAAPGINLSVPLQ